MAHTRSDEARLLQLVRSLTADERWAFWLGALIRDGAVTVDDALRSKGLL